jgi:predicted NBD/HSP70 family sugar kinase
MPKIRLPKLHGLRILNVIYDRGSISRSDIALQTGYSNFLVSKVCDSLLLDGLIEETGSGNSTGGRRPTLLSIRAGLGRVVGVHFGTVNARVIVTDLAGNQLAFVKESSRVKEGPPAALTNLVALINRALVESGSASEHIHGIGMGISGILDRASGTTVSWPKVPSWVNVGVRDFLAQHFDVVLGIEDTPRTMALAERRARQANGSQEFSYVMLGAGVGSALFLNGKLYTGKDGFAGEFGHVTVDEEGPVCACGSRGCLETLVSATALIRRAQEAVAQGLSSSLWHFVQGDETRISVELIVEAAKGGDRFCLRLLNEAATHLGKGIVALTHLLNPELIVLGGGLALAAGQMMLPTVLRVVSERALPKSASSVQIEVSSLADRDWACGASLLITHDVLKNMFLNSATARSLARDTRNVEVDETLLLMEEDLAPTRRRGAS